MQNIRNKKAFICDMDGVIYHGSKILNGVSDFVNWMIDNDKNSFFSPTAPKKHLTSLA